MSKKNNASLAKSLKDIAFERIFQKYFPSDLQKGEFYFEKRLQTDLALFDQKIERVSQGEDLGVALRIIHKGHTYFGTTQDCSQKGLEQLAENLSKNISAKKMVKKLFFKSPLKIPAKMNPIKIYPHKIKLKEKIKTLQECDRGARKNFKFIKQVKLSYFDEYCEIFIANTKGLHLSFSQVQTYLGATSIAKKNSITQTGFEPVGGTMGWELFSQVKPFEIGAKASQQAEDLLNAIPAPMGKWPVILSSKAGGTFVHEVLGHALEGDIVEEGLSIFEHDLGKKISKTPLSVIDDPSIPYLGGSYDFDDEGNPSHPKELVRNGILKNFLLDEHTASKMNLKSTGNARREDYHSRPIPRMSNIFIKPMKEDPEKIKKSLHRGILISQLGGGEVDTIKGTFIFEVTQGYLIQKGKKDQSIRGATLIGNIKEILEQDLLIANDLHFELGSCEKNGQDVWVSDGQPTLFIPEITIGGQEQ